MIYRWIMCVCIWVSWTQVYSAPGPDSTFLLLNQNSEVSIRIATAYQRARFLPDYHLCRLDLPIDDAMDLATFIDHLYTPLIDCLGDSLSSVDTLVLSKGIPLRVRDDQLGGISFSTSSLLSIAQSTYQDQPIWTAPLTEYGSCGPNVMCWRPYQVSPWTTGPLWPQWSRRIQEYQWKLWLVSRLDGYTEEAVIHLINQGVESDLHLDVQNQSQSGMFVLMRGADAARGVLDVEFEDVARLLKTLNQEVRVVDFNTDWIIPPLETNETAKVMGWVVGTSQYGNAIEGNLFLPGSIVDNLTSFGAVPGNFDLDRSESQVSVARWIDRGVSGIHGATDEPLNSSFPSRYFLVDYVLGASLVEAFMRHFPYVAWQNLVVGDPMIAPFAYRPHFDIQELQNQVQVSVVDPLGREVEYLSVLQDGRFKRYERSNFVELCAETAQESIVVAQVFGQEGQSTDEGEGWPAKGWQTIRIPSCSSPVSCSQNKK